MKRHRLPNRLGLTVCPTCTTVWDSWSLCHLRAAQCCSSVRSTELFQSVHMYGSHIEYCSANHSHHHQQNSGVPSMATNIQFIHPYLINTGLESEERQGTVQNKSKQSVHNVPVLGQLGWEQKLDSKCILLFQFLCTPFSSRWETWGSCNLPFLQSDSDLLQDLHCLFVVFQLGLHKCRELAHLLNLQKDGETVLQLPGHCLEAVYNMQHTVGDANDCTACHDHTRGSSSSKLI